MIVCMAVPLIHEPNMDIKPDIIPKGNIKKALSILQIWKKNPIFNISSV